MPEPVGDMVRISNVEVDEPEIDAVVAVLRSGKLRQGRLCAEFEERFAAAVGARHSVAVSSGTAALHIGWLALIDPGDEVLVPAFTFIATASCVVLAGGVPIFCDVEADTGNLDMDDARTRLTRRTRGLAPVHLYGQPCQIAAALALADEHGLRVVWDCAQAHGSRYGDRDVGAFADLACYSFYATKNMTMGEGGIVTTDNSELADKLRLLRSHGQAEKYRHTLVGLNYRLTEMQAAIGIRQLESLPEQNRRRRRNAAELSDRLKGLPGIRTPVHHPGTESSYHQYTIQVNELEAGISRDDLQRRMAERGIETAVHYPLPLHRQPVFAHAAEVSLPQSERLAREVLSLPVHPGLTTSDVARVADAVAEAVEQAGARARA